MNTNLHKQGRLADEKLAAERLTLTQGGEPTFVPFDTTAPEWNLAALGPEKLLFARRLAADLAANLFKGAVVLQSFGKQYPGEPLPRWQLGVYRSRSGAPLWHDLSRLRLGQESIAAGDADMPKRFIAELASYLGLEDASSPAYENLEAKLRFLGSDEATQLLPRFSRSKRAFESKPLPDDIDEKWQAYFEPAGWILPLDHDGDKWSTGAWKLPDGDDLTLIPGDSPVGLRLLLSSLPEDAIKRGLSAELKDGELILFLPPLSSFECFVELIQAIEHLATKLDLPPLRLEGYTPPGDDDVESIGLTSDPGVLEINLPPADNWEDYERVIRGLFKSAAAVGMCAHKYQLSGRCISTGGGAHIVLGGPDLDRNPFIQRPTLLSSFLRFVQNHPSLSYAFSGLFTGASSQAPRVDESAFDLPYELEISLKAMEDMQQPGDPVMIDALLRNLLMDWNGNTHRAELSVDKFYNFNAPNGQNGLIEFRAFEMVPEPEPLLAANALLRALTACFAEQPYTSPLKDWRETLHDQFMLPYFLRKDLGNVLTYLAKHGFSFSDDDFEAQFDFRFPVITHFATDDINWTLRHAIEPWPVMGEHQGSGRIVDSTTDRLELLVEGDLAPAGLVVTVNGYRLPMQQVNDAVAVGAIRYRLFDNPWGLQPHVRAHSPLRVAVIEATSGRIKHAFDFFNWNPGNQGYDGLPSTAHEAKDRVAERLSELPELVGTEVTVQELAASSRAPYTLDLRRSHSAALQKPASQ